MADAGKVAFCFPGQGSQEPGMGRAMAEAVPEARAVYDRASHALGFDLAEACFEGTMERLSETEVTQPAIIATSIACLRGLLAAGVRADYVVGHSVGEYAALAAAEAVDDETTVKLVRERGLAMAEAARTAPGAMAAVIGLEDDEVERLCAEIDGVWPANYNCPGQIVVSGTEAGVAMLMELAERAGARRTVRLRVSGGFHSPLTAMAAKRLRPVLQAARFAEPVTPFLSTVTCRVESARRIAPILVRQLTAPVKFTQAVETLRASGVRTFVEVGAGNVLSGLVKRIDRGLHSISVSAPEGIQKVQEHLGRA
jgi:[acyl-carrier-protein] S-malonyltransferase